MEFEEKRLRTELENLQKTIKEKSVEYESELTASKGEIKSMKEKLDFTEKQNVGIQRRLDAILQNQDVGIMEKSLLSEREIELQT